MNIFKSFWAGMAGLAILAASLIANFLVRKNVFEASSETRGVIPPAIALGAFLLVGSIFLIIHEARRIVGRDE